MMKLLYSRSEMAYNAHYEDLKQYCMEAKRLAFFAYFEKNWDSCSTDALRPIVQMSYIKSPKVSCGNSAVNLLDV
ncbi:uncharacterized protein KRP23_14321 [Phytophthora ramorum]|uniref:uncharacterized protein n=1 Tax=Phytophthora ramorum TaxID=164328 RepID=UPI0030A9A1FE|nr:hypothetical protein KRP23_14321 [Phytophthora ramorum]